MNATKRGLLLVAILLSIVAISWTITSRTQLSSDMNSGRAGDFSVADVAKLLTVAPAEAGIQDQATSSNFIGADSDWPTEACFDGPALSAHPVLHGVAVQGSYHSQLGDSITVELYQYHNLNGGSTAEEVFGEAKSTCIEDGDSVDHAFHTINVKEAESRLSSGDGVVPGVSYNRIRGRIDGTGPAVLQAHYMFASSNGWIMAVTDMHAGTSQRLLLSMLPRINASLGSAFSASMPPVQDVRSVDWRSAVDDIQCWPDYGSLLVDQQFVDVNTDGRVDAIVSVRCGTSTSTNPLQVEVFDGADLNHPRRIGILVADSDRRIIRESKEVVTSNSILVIGRGLTDGESLATGSNLTIYETFRWTGDAFVLQDSREQIDS